MSYLKSSLTLLVFLIISVLSSHASAAPLTRIECPHESMAYGATTPTSGGWVPSTIVFRLSDASVATVRGRQELTCHYGSHARVTRYGPDGQTCSAVDNGFTCGVVRTVIEPERTERLVLAESYLADIDRMRVGGAELGRKSDIWFNAVSSTERYIAPMNGAAWRTGMRTAPGYSGCTEGTFSTAQIDITHLRTGTYGCVLTTAGRIAEFKITRQRNARVWQIEFLFKLYPEG